MYCILPDVFHDMREESCKHGAVKSCVITKHGPAAGKVSIFMCRHIYPMLDQCWASVVDVDVDVPCLLEWRRHT